MSWFGRRQCQNINIHLIILTLVQRIILLNYTFYPDFWKKLFPSLKLKRFLSKSRTAQTHTHIHTHTEEKNAKPKVCSSTLCAAEHNFCVFQMGDTTKLLHNSEKHPSVPRGHETGGLHWYGHPGLLDEYVWEVRLDFQILELNQRCN